MSWAPTTSVTVPCSTSAKEARCQAVKLLRQQLCPTAPASQPGACVGCGAAPFAYSMPDMGSRHMLMPRPRSRSSPRLMKSPPMLMPMPMHPSSPPPSSARPRLLARGSCLRQAAGSHAMAAAAACAPGRGVVRPAVLLEAGVSGLPGSWWLAASWDIMSAMRRAADSAAECARSASARRAASTRSTAVSAAVAAAASLAAVSTEALTPSSVSTASAGSVVRAPQRTSVSHRASTPEHSLMHAVLGWSSLLPVGTAAPSSSPRGPNSAIVSSAPQLGPNSGMHPSPLSLHRLATGLAGAAPSRALLLLLLAAAAHMPCEGRRATGCAMLAVALQPGPMPTMWDRGWWEGGSAEPDRGGSARGAGEMAPPVEVRALMCA
mmetsp:Transcript_9480/g.23482  ORF Transcript_9480/g.23482 Transcript_9480/m.23482 type:complete len:378 (-) Transcript_9480:2238-3371(-)